MVAKKTAVQQSAGRSADASGGTRASADADAAGGGAGRKSARAGAAGTDAAGEGTAEKGAAERRTASKAAAVRETASGETATGAPPGATAARGTPGKAAEEGGAGGGGTGKRAVGKSTAGAAAGRKSTVKKVDAAQTAEQTGATTVVGKKTPGTATAAKTAVPKARFAAAEPGELAVRPGEDPWTPEEVEEARTELQSEEARLRAEITSSERSLAGLMRDSGDGAGDDQADTGTKNITREHELALAANAREMLTQTERALERLDAGTYGLCENCGNPIGKARMQAFPRATLCVECKQKQERRY
ncbi:TraR/DksA family transcriptional regulator [Streptomyces glaucus]|uniref:TraR/DksA family transcriptional regulator n=1 Tax=Streptomyces glaucus TaxID=284029 RepID=A0ABN3JFZ9_9ACTN